MAGRSADIPLSNADRQRRFRARHQLSPINLTARTHALIEVLRQAAGETVDVVIAKALELLLDHRAKVSVKGHRRKGATAGLAPPSGETVIDKLPTSEPAPAAEPARKRRPVSRPAVQSGAPPSMLQLDLFPAKSDPT